jgi:hypothetical protein
MAASVAELAGIERAWLGELEQALRERSAWAVLADVEIARPTIGATIGGTIDRRLIDLPSGQAVGPALEAWRHTQEGRIVDRIVQSANTALLARLPAPNAVAEIGASWQPLLGQGPIALLGQATDLVAAVRVARQSGADERLRPCPADAPAGRLVAVGRGKEPVSVKLVLSCAVAPAPKGVCVIVALEVKSRETARLVRVDVTMR